jgi:chromosome partitioning protein
VQATLEIVPEATPHGLIVCAARTGTRDVAETIEMWEQAGEKVWGTIPERVSIAGAATADLSVIGLVFYDNILRKAIAAAKRAMR